MEERPFQLRSWATETLNFCPIVQSDSPERTVYVPLAETVGVAAARLVSVMGNRAPLVGTMMRVPVRSDLALTPGLAAVIVLLETP